MEVIAWIAVAVAVAMSGEHDVQTSALFKTQEFCQEAVAQAVEILKDAPLMAYGINCVPVTIGSGAGITKQAPSPKQQDLDKSEGVTPPKFRSTTL